MDFFFPGKLCGAERGARRKVSSWCIWNGEDIPGKWPSSILADGNRETVRDLGTNGRWREGAVNQGKPVSTHYVKDIMCKVSITGDLISLGNCSQSSPFMTIFVFSVPKSVKGRTFHLRSQKNHNMLTSVINLSTVSAVSTLWTSRFHATRAAVIYLTLCDDVPPTTYGTNGLLELWNKRERKNCVALWWSLLIIFFCHGATAPTGPRISSLSRLHDHTQTHHSL